MLRKKRISKNDFISDSLSKNAWRKFRKDKLAVFGACVLSLCILVAMFGSLIRPDQTEDVQQTSSNIELKPPGFKVTILKEHLDHKIPEVSVLDRMFFGGKSKRFKNYAINPDYKFEGAYILFSEYSEKLGRSKLIKRHLAQILYPLEFDNVFVDTETQSTFQVLGNTSLTRDIEDMRSEIETDYIFERKYWLGTTKQGRDLLSLIMASIIISISVGFIALIISISIGVTLGAIAGFFRGRVDDVIMYIINVFWSVPALLVVLALTMAVGPGFKTICITIGLTLWVDIARIVRGQVLSVREQEFIEASKALGFSTIRTIFKHVLPNIIGPLIVMSASIFAVSILLEAGLSFLGLGTQEPQPSLGLLVSQYKDNLTVDGQAFLVVLPSLAIILLVLVFMLIGNGLRDALDAKTQTTSLKK